MKKLQVIQAHLSSNGIRWTSYFLISCYLKRILNKLQRRMSSLEQKYLLPGDNTPARNYAMWQDYNWEKKGEEWTVSPEWKQSLIDEVMLKYITPGKTIVEIGPGAGRWTETLQKIAKKLILVDLSNKCIELCKQRFSRFNNIEFFVNDGANIDFIQSETVDFIWSFDVFVHVNPVETEQYIKGLSRILKKGGRCIIHHSKEGRSHEYKDNGWRSNMTAKLFRDMLKKHELILVRQFDSWGNRQQFDVKHYHDIITVFEK